MEAGCCIHDTIRFVHDNYDACLLAINVFTVLFLQILGDQQAALVGQTCYDKGMAKNT